MILANADMTEIYQWTPTNSAEVVAFVLHVKSLIDQTGTITLTGDSPATTTDHAVDAGNILWAFTLPQPTVTHTAVQPIDHTVAARNITWAFTLPQPTVTHTTVLPQTYTVNAGNISWAFTLPQPTVTHTSVLPTDHTVNAGNISWVFAHLPQPTVTHTASQGIDHTVNARNIRWAFTLPQPTVTSTGFVAGPLSLPAVGTLTTQIFRPFQHVFPSAFSGTPPYQYFLGGLPAGFSFDSATRQLAGTAEDAALIGTARRLTYCVIDDDGTERQRSVLLCHNRRPAPTV